LASWSVVEYTYDYSDNLVAGAGAASFDIHIERDMEPPIWVYYELHGFHQNHRRYIKSVDAVQMNDPSAPEVRGKNLQCQPWKSTNGRVNYPCGLVAKSVFNDSYVLVSRGPEEGADWHLVDVDSSASTIAWPADTRGKFLNLNPEATTQGGGENQIHVNMWINRLFPPVECRQVVISDEKPFVPVHVAMRQERVPASGSREARTVDVVDCKGYMGREAGIRPDPTCNFVRLGQNFTCEGDYKLVPSKTWGIESGHFIVWMRVAGLPSFRNAWGRIDRRFPAGSTLRVYFGDNFPVTKFHGRKAFVLSSTNFLGGRNDFFGYGYLVVGCSCLIFAGAFMWRHLVKPRPLGDISLLASQYT